MCKSINSEKCCCPKRLCAYGCVKDNSATRKIQNGHIHLTPIKPSCSSH